jgi:quercetin dioxygenase-like cupin family protein
MIRRAAPLALLLLCAAASIADAQAPGIKRTLLQKNDVGEGREAILGLAEIASGGSTGRHTHFGTEMGYVVEGTATLEIEGEAARSLKAGDSYTIPAGKVHNATASGGATKVLATYIVDKGKPLATPAP